MIARFLITLLLLFNFYNSFAQLNILGDISGFEPNRQIYLSYYIGEKLEPVDSCIINLKGEFEFSVNEDMLHDGLYEIQFDKNVGLPLIFTKSDKIIKIKNLIFEDLKQHKTPYINKENDEFTSLSKAYIELQKKIGAIVNRKNMLNPYISNQTEELEVLRKDYDSLEKAFNSYLDEFRIKNKGTYAADIMSEFFYRSIKPSEIENEHTYLKEHHFDYLKFSDERIIYNPLINEKLYDYLVNYSGLTVEGFQDAVNQIMGRALLNDKVKEFALNFLITLFLDKGPEEVVFHIYDNFVEGCSSKIGEVDIKRIKQLRNFKVGMLGKDIESIDPNGEKVVLSEVIGEAPIILLFWSSHCTHCAIETPKLLSLYHKYQDKGLNVFAVSLDSNKIEWTTYIGKNNLNWINVCDLKEFNGQAPKDYFVFGTPTIFVLDNELKILYKQPSIEYLEKEFVNLFK